MSSIEYINTIMVEDYNNLREAVGWSRISVKRAQIGLNNSSYIVAAKYKDKTVGTARLISDCGYVAYIADVIVLPEFQGQGIGKAMIEMVLEYIKANMDEGDSVCVCLMAAKGKELFYNQFHFHTRPDDKFGAGMSQWINK